MKNVSLLLVGIAFALGCAREAASPAVVNGAADTDIGATYRQANIVTDPEATKPLGDNLIMPRELPTETVEFIGTITQTPALPKATDAGRKALSVGVDPHYLVTIRIESVISGKAPFAVPSEQAFLIHSPAQSLVTDSHVGDQRRFRLALCRDNKTPRFLVLSAHPLQ